MLLLITFNFNTLNDLIPSSFFTTLKTHVIFLLDNSITNLNSSIMFFILFFTTTALIFLLNLRYSFNYFYFYNNYVLDLLLFTVVLYLFTPYLLIFVYLIVIGLRF